MVTIADLPPSLENITNGDFRNEPLLKYIVPFAEKHFRYVGFSPEPYFLGQGTTIIFLKRYFEGAIDTSFKDAYLANKELQDTLGVYGIDVSAFWYLILFLKDYVDDESCGPVINNSAYNKLRNLAAKMYEMGFQESPLDGEYWGCKNKGKLQFRIGSKHWETIDDDKTLYAIFCAICAYLRRNKRPKYHKEWDEYSGEWIEVENNEYEPEIEHLFTTHSSDDNEIITLPETYKISYFTTYMRDFLKPFTTTNKDWHISNDKWLLISRVIYTIGYSSDVRYNTRKKANHITDFDFLKGNYIKERYPKRISRSIYV